MNTVQTKKKESEVLALALFYVVPPGIEPESKV